MTGSSWEIDAYMPTPERWSWLTMTHEHGASAAIRIVREARGFVWVWREHWLGMTTTLLSGPVFRDRRHCVAHLANVMRELEIAFIPTVLEKLL